MAAGDVATIECSSCGDEVTIEEAAMLTAEQSKGVWRYLCTPCLEDLGVPRGYTVKRDLSFLRGGASPADGTPDTVEGADATPDGVSGADGTEVAERESAVIADFRGEVVTAETPGGRLARGRILMDRHRLVLVTEGSKTGIPLGAVRDVTDDLDSVEPDEPAVVGVVHHARGEEDIAFVRADGGTLSKFLTTLFKALLNGTFVRVKRPTTAGGGVVTGRLDVREAALGVDGPEPPIELPRERVSAVETGPRGWAEAGTTVLAVTHGSDEGSVVTELSLPSARVARLAGRYVGPD